MAFSKRPSWLRTQNPIYKDLFKYWIKIFAVASVCVVWVVLKVTSSVRTGVNFHALPEVLLVLLLTYEVLSAFFLEAGFLGIMLFGWGRVGPMNRCHYCYLPRYERRT